MSFSSWVDARLVAFAPTLAVAVESTLTNPNGPMMKQLQSMVATNEAKLQQAMTAQSTKDMITAAVKAALPFPL
jgi:hypothetical protein